MPTIPPLQPAPPVFERVLIDYLVLGGTRVQWTMGPNFLEATPWVFQAQVAEANTTSANWTNVGSPVTDEFMLTDPTQEWYAKQSNAFYRIQITTDVPNVYYSEPQDVMGKLDYHNWGIAQELVRKEKLRLQYLRVGIEGYFLKAKHSGTPCAACLDPYTKEVTDSNCPTCYGQRWVGGFYTAVPCVYGDVNPFQRYDNRSLETEGMINPQLTKGIFIAAPFMAMNDVWVDTTSDLRYWIHEVNVSTHLRGTPLVTDVAMRPIPTDNVIYTVPVPGIGSIHCWNM